MTNNRIIKRHLVIGGGGAAGVAIAGAIDQLSKEPRFSFEDLQSILGTSVGAIAALMIVLKYTPQEILEKLSTINLKEIEDGGYLFSELYRTLAEYGKYKGEVLYELIKSFIAEKTGRNDPENVTFADLKKAGYQNLYVVTTKIYEVNGKPTGKKKIFCYEKHPNTPVAAVVHASAAAPLYFSCVPLKKIEKGKYLLDKQGDLFADGGLTSNYDITFFDQLQFMSAFKNVAELNVNPETMGIALLNTNQIIDERHQAIKERIAYYHPIEFYHAVINTLLKEFEDNQLDRKENRDRTIQIDRKGIKLDDFDKVQNHPAIKEMLIESGRQAVRNYYNNLDLQLNKPRVEMNHYFNDKKVTVGKLWDKKPVANDDHLNETSSNDRSKCVLV